MSIATSSRRAFLACVFPLSVVLATAGCASGPKEPMPVVKQVRVLPVMPIDRMYTENTNLASMMISKIADRSKSGEFTARLDEARGVLARRFTDELVKELNAQGFEANVMQGVDRPVGDTEGVDYASLPGKEPVLHVYFSAVGMYSSKFSLDYLPRINVEAVLISPGRKNPLYEESIYYGADARGIASWSVPADPRYKWPTFDALVGNRDQVVQSYQEGIDGLARRIALNIKEQVAH